MKSNRNALRHALLAGAALVIGLALALASCNFGFLDDADLSGSDEELTVVETAFDGGKRYSYYNSDTVLQYYEDHFITDSKTMQIQRYSAEDLLRYGYLYQYDGNNRTLVAYYDSASTLKWYQVFTYTGTLVQTSAEFDEAGILQWSRRYDYLDGTLVPTTKLLVRAASFDGEGNPTGCADYTYDMSDRVSFMTSYGTVNCSVAGISASTRAFAASPRSAARSIASFSPPTTITFPDTTMPDATALATLAISGYTYWHYDLANNGISELRLNSDWYPVRVSHSDDWLAKTVSVELEWNDANQISRKKSYYGSTLALDVSMTYNDDGYPLKASTRGAAMFLPLDYELVYAGGVPTRLNVSSNGSLIQWFAYVYEGETVVPPLSLAEARSIDPFALLDTLAKSSLTIEHHDGDDILIETFTFSSLAAGLKLEVKNAAGESNGYYELAYDGELIASLKAFNASSVEQWEYSYGYAEAMDDAAALAGATGIPADFGRLAETYLTNDIQEYAKGFVMDLLF